jgi:D-tyrosyl-tRNA(Tyr) deacylase
MRAVVQRVSAARVHIGDREHAKIGQGLLVLVGIDRDDREEDATRLAKKVTELRVFEDARGRMNQCLLETGGSVLAVSQFTLLGDVRKGRRPSFDRAAEPETARHLYQCFVDAVARTGVPVSTGVFQAMMDVQLTNSGPVTLLLDTRRVF